MMKIPVCVSVVLAAFLASPVGAIQRGSLDINTPDANSVVRIFDDNRSLQCTGTLVQPDLVLTAGHCVARADVFHRNQEKTGVWYTANRNFLDSSYYDQTPVTGHPIRIGVGHDRRNFVFETRAKAFNVIHDTDIALLALEQPVPARLATPQRVLLKKPANVDWRKQRFQQVGWGGGAGNIRKQGGASNGVNPCSRDGWTQSDKLCVIGSGTRGGDSGGPLFWRDRAGSKWLVGVTQQAEGSYSVTFLPGGTRSTNDSTGASRPEPNISAYLGKHASTSGCSQLRSQAERGAPYISLVSWYSPVTSRRDNSTTANEVWQGCAGDKRSPGYQFVHIEGRLFSPGRRQPAGTIPLYKWYSSKRGDNWTTSQFNDKGQRRQGLSPDYNFIRIEGYIYPPSYAGKANVKPLYSWYSPSRSDNWTTTQHSSVGRRSAALSPDYRFVRLEGYVLAPASNP